MSSDSHEETAFDAEDALVAPDTGNPAKKFRAVDLVHRNQEQGRELGEFSHDTSHLIFLSPLDGKQKSVPSIHHQQLHNQASGFTGRMPLSRPEIAPTSSSSSPGRASCKCPELPVFLSSNTTFHCHETNFDKIKELVEKALKELEDEYDWSYCEDGCVWKVKFLKGSHSREKRISCYWDSRREDHLIEVKRVKGDGFAYRTAEFFGKLKSVVTGSTMDELEREADMEKRRKVSKLRGGPLPLPLPMLPLNRSSSSGAAATVPLSLPPLSLSNCGAVPLPSFARSPAVAPPTEEQFLKGLQPISSMLSSSSFYEIRLEATKMLCDLVPQLTANQTKLYLELPACVELVTKSLEKGIVDEMFPDIQQFSVIAFAMFAAIPAYQEAFLKSPIILYQIIPIIRNVAHAEHFYQTAQMRRQAAYGLLLIAKNLSRFTQGKDLFVDVMRESGYETKGEWELHAKSLLDKRTREYSLEVCMFF